jgi:hypothetical protein
MLPSNRRERNTLCHRECLGGGAVIAQVCASRDLRRELIRGYVEGKSAPADSGARQGTMQCYYQAVASPVGVRLQANQIKAIDAWAAKQQPAVTRPEAIRGIFDAMLHILAKDPGEKAKIR